MCGGIDSEATVKGNTTLEQEKKNRMDAGRPAPTPSNSAASFAADPMKLMLQGFTIKPPADSPDITDALLRQRRASEFSRLNTTRGRADSFLGGGDYGGTRRATSMLGDSR